MNRRLKHTIYVLSLLLALFALANNTNAQTKNGAYQKAYQQLCASCHGRQMETFYKETWINGFTTHDISKTIEGGIPDVGMPSFGQVLQKVAIQEMADYIIQTVRTVPKPASNFIAPHKKHITGSASFTVDTILSNIGIPWGMTWLDSCTMLITERSGNAYLFKNGVKTENIKGLPIVIAERQGGLMDVEIDPNYKENGWIYFSYSKPDDVKPNVGNTAIMRAKLNGITLTNKQLIFEAEPKTKRVHHWGCRLEFDDDGFLYFSIGDRGQRNDFPQKLNNDCGKIHRIFPDGRIPKNNPYKDENGERSSIYSYGHRNPQGLAKHPETGKIWSHEHGPKGGDELNIICKGKNYGWPVISYGINYNGTKFTNDTVKRGMKQPVMFWRPSIAPCGMTFVTGDKFPGWKNNILIGSLSFKYLERVVLDGNKKLYTEKLLPNIGRVRNVKMGPDGYVYVAIEKPGKILKLVPIKE